MKSIFYTIIFTLAVMTLPSCDDDITQIEDNAYDDILLNTGENIILATYSLLANRAVELRTATVNFKNNPTNANLEIAKNAWVSTRLPWEQSEGFLFGPVDQEGLDPNIDSWPVNVVDLKNVLNSGKEITVAFLNEQEGTLKGFHTIEFLLWGEGGNKGIADFTQKELEYLVAAAGSLAQDTKELYDLWAPNSGNFINNMINAGKSNSIYISQKSVLEEIANGLIIIVDEVGNGKINDPLSQNDLTLEESRFSANSKADFANNIRSVKHIYTGFFTTTNTGTKESIGQIIESKKPNIHTKILLEIDQAISNIENIPGTFSDAVVNNKSAVSKAQASVRVLQNTFESELLPIISGL